LALLKARIYALPKRIAGKKGKKMEKTAVFLLFFALF